ncbi:MAG TPA: hypothetical protein VJ963_07975 [Bacteroidales bacterium]|nr:hypothetical protein [Bacteroidales bacterium]
MKIIPFDTSGEFALYCPSTNEIIFSSDEKRVNYKAEAFVAVWMDEHNYNPMIKDSELLTGWKEFLRLSFKKEPITDEMVTTFLKGYKNPDWIVYTSTFEPADESIDIFTVWFVVIADTIIE